METHIKAQSLPTWAETLTACQRPERGCLLSHPSPKENQILPQRLRITGEQKTGYVRIFQMTVDLEVDQMWALNAKRFVYWTTNPEDSFFLSVYNTSTQIYCMFLALECLSRTLKACMCLSCSLCSVVYSLLLDIRPCWTAGRGSHRSDQPSLSWWNSWEIYFRPACNRYDRQKKSVYCLKSTYDVSQACFNSSSNEQFMISSC